MPSRQCTRRLFLQASTLLGAMALGGCSQPLSPERTPERVLALSFSEVEGTLREQYVFDLEETPMPWDEAAFDAAVNGSSFTTQGYPPFGDRSNEPRYAHRDGTYYHLGSVVVGKQVVTHPVLRLETVGRTDDLASVPEHVSHAELPEPDRHAVEIAYFAARARGNSGGVPWGLVERDGYVYRNETAIQESHLLGANAPTHVEYRDSVYEVAVARETFHEAVYRADVEPVAESEADVEAVLQAQLVDAHLDPNALSQAEQTVVREARREGYSEPHPFSSAYESVLKKLDKWAYLDGNVEKDADAGTDTSGRFVRYGDGYLHYRLAFESDTGE